MRIVFVRMRSLGDIVLMTPVLAAAKRKPDSIVGVVCENPFDEILQRNPDVDLLITSSRQKAWLSRIKVIREVRNFRPDLVVDLHGGTTSSLITGLSGAPTRVGYSTSRNSFFYNQVTPDTREIWGRERIHTVEHQLAPLKHLGFPVEPIPPLHVPLDQSDVRFVQELLIRGGLFSADEIESSKPSSWSEDRSRGSCDSIEESRDEPPVNGAVFDEFSFVLVHPGAAFETKQWPVDRCGELIQRLRNDGLRVVVTCGPGEAHHLERLAQLVDEGVKFVPPLSLSRFVALASLCRVYVGNDTGTTHIAAALKKPIVAVFGSSDSTVWYPWGVDFELVKSDLPCIPCPGYSCSQYDEPVCIQTVPVDRVYTAVKKLME